MTPEIFFDLDPGGVNRGLDPGGVKPGSTPFDPDPEKTLNFSLMISCIFCEVFPGLGPDPAGS